MQIFQRAYGRDSTCLTLKGRNCENEENRYVRIFRLDIWEILDVNIRARSYDRTSRSLERRILENAESLRHHCI